MGLIENVARTVLIVVNILFLLLGFSLSVVGFVLRFGESLYKSYLDVGINKLKAALQDTNLDNFDVDSININELLTTVAIGFIFGGLFLFGIAFCGCYGAFSKSKTLLWIYAAVIFIFVVCEIIVIAVLYGKPDLVKDRLKTELKDFAGLGSSEVFSVGWNIFMIQFKCCGVDSYQDFDSSASSRWNSVTVGGTTYTLESPIACCKILPTSTTLNNCTVSPIEKSRTNCDKGCYDTVWGYTLGNSAMTVPILVVCGLIQVLFFISAIYLSKSTSKDKVKPLY